MQPTANKWLLPKRGVQGNPDGLRLFCVPQAGMGAWVYQNWSDKLAPHIQVLPVELPGHGSRMCEPRSRDLCALSRQIVEALTDLLQSGPYALFGHSMGAWIVWEVLQEITRRNLPQPAHLYVSCNRAPHLSGASHDLDSVRMHILEPAQFWPAMERRYGANPYLENPAVRSVMYPMLKDDFAMVETYQPSAPETTTAVAITAIGAQSDIRYTTEQLSAWGKHTTGQFTEIWLKGVGHNYIEKTPETLLETIQAQLCSLRNSIKTLGT